MATLKTSLQKLLPATRKSGRLPAAQDREPIPAGQGVGSRSKAQEVAATSSGGIASPLTETPGTRETHPIKIITSSDGIFAWEYHNIKKLTLTDTNSATVEINREDV